VKQVLRKAFAGFPWHETLSRWEINRRWDFYVRQQGFCGLVEIRRIRGKDTIVVGAIFGDKPNVEKLIAERGQELGDFVKSLGIISAEEDYPENLVWIREIVVDPNFQNQGIGLALRLAFIDTVSCFDRPTLFLTRLRDDNLPIIQLAEKCQFVRTGIRIPSSQKPGIFHEYWFRIVQS